MNYSQFNEKGKSIAEAIVTALKAEGFEAEIAKTYLDYGQDWYWDTILVTNRSGAKYQALNPRQFEDMNSGDFNYAEIQNIVLDARQLNR